MKEQVGLFSMRRIQAGRAWASAGRSPACWCPPWIRDVIYVTNTKSGKDRVVPMNQPVREELLRMSEQSDGEFVFVSKRTGLNLTEIKKGFNAACREAEIRNFKVP